MLALVDERGAAVDVEPEVFVIAGYTGRDRAMVQKHIDELAHEGIAPPPQVPMLYQMPVEILTDKWYIEVPTASTSGEVEPVLIGVGDALYLGIGSDHTARDVEREDIATSKRICPKPVGRSIVRLQAFGPEIDQLTLESAVDAEPYQSGSLAQIAPLGDLFALFRAHYAATNFVLFCGTVPLRDGFRFGRHFRAKLGGAPLPQPLVVEYDIEIARKRA